MENDDGVALGGSQVCRRRSPTLELSQVYFGVSVLSRSLHDAPAGSHVSLQLSTGREPALPGPGAHCHDGPGWPREQHDGTAAYGTLPTVPAR